MANPCKGVHTPAIAATHARIEAADGSTQRGELQWCIECGAIRATQNGTPIGPWWEPGSRVARCDFDRLERAGRSSTALEVS